MPPPFGNRAAGIEGPGEDGNFAGSGRGGRGRGPRAGGLRGGRGSQTEVPDATDAGGWFRGRLPDAWFVGQPSIIVDREEITVVGELTPIALADGETQADEAAQAAAEVGRIARFREDTRSERIEIARQAEHRYGRHITWGARIGTTEQVFTHLSVPVMTRLKQADRQVLDTLIDAGVARSRSEALAWAVRLVGENAGEWLGELRSAMEHVATLRDQGPNRS